MKLRANNFAQWLVITVVIATIGLFSWRYSSLSRHYVSVQGIILRLYPYSHQSFDYFYTVGNDTHFGTATASGIGRDLAKMKIGDHLTVFYDAQHPADSTAESPSLRGFMSICVFVFGGVFISFGIFLKFRHPSLPGESRQGRGMGAI